MGSTEKLRHEAGCVAVHRDGEARHVLMSSSEPSRIKVDGKAASMSPHLVIELTARGRSVILGIGKGLPSPVTVKPLNYEGTLKTQIRLIA